MSPERLNVIALISGGKDSFFSLLHCLHHGHRVVALANLFPATDDLPQDFQAIDPVAAPGSLDEKRGVAEAEDLNSFMYQTVGHEIIPLYAAATGLPVYRQPIVGGVLRHERDYDCNPQQMTSGDDDETESMIPLLKSVMSRHPEANALCAGAILSTYQRTRVESVALRLGLTPLAYLWKYPILPHLTRQSEDDAQLLRDMADSGLEARIIKVASAGLDEGHLWRRVSSVDGAEEVKRALRKFGAVGGAVLGEGGEFETVVVDGPSSLFKKRINVPDTCRSVVQEGGGSTWLLLRGATLEDKPEAQDSITAVPAPDLFDAGFQAVLDDLSHPSALEAQGTPCIADASKTKPFLGTTAKVSSDAPELLYWSVLGDQGQQETSIEMETVQVADKTRQLLDTHGLDPGQISNTVVILRRMADFPKVNAVYGKLFKRANPPARVTVSCGDLLPPGCNVAVYLTISPSQPSLTDRQGLHVQSRSYWAPANIGPYSQAVGVRVVAQNEATSLRTWSIAGQIPLIPYSMELPVESPTSTLVQIVLSLQHLWRIGLDLKIQAWTSAVAFFASNASSSESQVGRKAQIAALAWKLAHGTPDDSDEAESGPDPWDLKYNPQFMSLSGEHTQATAKPRLPDWEVFTLRQQNEPESCIPPCFAVEVEELPKQSEVEWHAHIGLSQVEESSVELVRKSELGPSGAWTAWHTIAKTSTFALVHTVVTRHLPNFEEKLTFSSFKEELSEVYSEAVQHLQIEVTSEHQATPHLTYMDAGAIDAPWAKEDSQGTHPQMAVIPCKSVWSSEGKRLGVISLYRTVVKF